LAPQQGFTLRIPDYRVKKGNEAEDCYFFAVPDINNGQAIFINEFDITTTNRDAKGSSSHHTNVYRVGQINKMGDVLYAPPGGKVVGGECPNQGAIANWPLVVNVQGDPDLSWVLPMGTAQKFQPGDQLMIQTHWLNTTTEDQVAQVRVDFHKSPVANPIEMGAQLASHSHLNICESPGRPISYDLHCKIKGNQPVQLVAANGHFHSRGVDFAMYNWDGQAEIHSHGPDGDEVDNDPKVDGSDVDQFYDSTDWTHPKFQLGINKTINPGEGLWFTCTYQWAKPDPLGVTCDQVDQDNKNTDCCFTFGPKAEENEHCIAFFYYYPKVADSDIECDEAALGTGGLENAN
jgi:hypothetical protein